MEVLGERGGFARLRGMVVVKSEFLVAPRTSIK